MTVQRIARLRSALRQQRLDAMLVSTLPHIRYLTNFSGSNAILTLSLRRAVLYTDSRYAHQVTREAQGVTCRITSGGLVEAASRDLRDKVRRVGFESEHLVHDQYRSLGKHLPGVRLVPLRGVVEAFASVKEKREVAAIKAAVAISEAVLQEVAERIRPNVMELDVAAEVSFLHKRKGAEGDAFDPIVASGIRSALPHARPTRKRIKNGELVILDIGCRVHGYCSDITRTIVVGRATSQVLRMHAAVSDAVSAALEGARAMVETAELDKLARNRIIRAGYGKYFVHSLGHGLGLQVHERPRLSRTSSERLESGNVVTIEPGIYLPSLGGVRIEEDILVTSTGCRPLGRLSRDLLIV